MPFHSRETRWRHRRGIIGRFQASRRGRTRHPKHGRAFSALHAAKGREFPPQNPAAELGAASSSLEEFKAEIASRLALWRRTRRSIEFEGGDPVAGRQWLETLSQASITAADPDFSLPGKITITVPFHLIADTPFNITVVDTRGVDGSAVRPDIVGHLKNKRAVTVLCSKWGSAPDPSLQDVLKHVSETEVDPALFSRVAVLVLARTGDALSMRRDSGESAEDVAEGYEIKGGHVADALQRIGLLGVESAAFDAANDASADLTKFLIGKVRALRQAQAAAAKATVTAVDQMLVNVEEAQALATLEAINNELRIFAERHDLLKDRGKPVQTRLLSAIRDRHPRTVGPPRAVPAASGTLTYTSISVTAQRQTRSADASLRSRPSRDYRKPPRRSRIRKRPHLLGPVARRRQCLGSGLCKGGTPPCRCDLRAASLRSDRPLGGMRWQIGRGLNYKEVIASLIERWFDRQESLQDEFDRRVERAWRYSVLTPLGTASGTDVQREAA